MNGPQEDSISIRALKDIAESERKIRSKGEELVRQYIGLLTRLAYKVDGLKMEDARRKDPLAPADWGPAEWEAHFTRALAESVTARWSQQKDPEAEELRGRIEELQGEIQRLRDDLANSQDRVKDLPREREAEKQPQAEAPRPKPSGGRIVGSQVEWPQTWPQCPDRFVAALTAANITGERLKRAQMVMWLIATRGFSAYIEIADHVAAQQGLKDGRSGSFYRLYVAMGKAGLIEGKTIYVVANSQRYRMMLALLTKTGEELSQVFGWKTVESEWNILRRLHRADVQAEHAGAILAFALNARRHGYAVELVPKVSGPSEPDAKITRGGEVEYVEVELANEKDRKWRNLADLQGHVALCAGNPDARMTLAAEARLAKIKGKATDLESLMRIADDPDASIWMEEW
jgi:hypothetical protein